MKVFYSMPYSFGRMIEGDLPLEAIAASGWGHLIERVHVELERAGCEIVEWPVEADIEFYVGQPATRLKPEMHPCVTLSMYETTRPQDYWVDTFNLFDAVVNPSEWGRETFIKSGVTSPVHVAPLGVDTDRFSFSPRTTSSPWTYIAQAVQLTDRKEIRRVGELFRDDKMPSDTYLFLKTMPSTGGQEVRLMLHPQIEWIQENLKWERLNDLYDMCHTSVNPSAGEGFGFLAAEHMLSGMCVLMSDCSGFKEMIKDGYNLAMPAEERITPHYPIGRDYLVEDEDILSAMLWTYEHQEEALEMGKRASDWVAETFTFERLVQRLIPIFEDVIKTTPKTVDEYKDTDDLNDWIHLYDVFGGRFWSLANSQLLSPRILEAMNSARSLGRYSTLPQKSIDRAEYSS